MLVNLEGKPGADGRRRWASRGAGKANLNEAGPKSG